MKGRYFVGLLALLGLVVPACDEELPGEPGGSGGSSASAGENGDAGDHASGAPGSGGKGGGTGGTSQGSAGESAGGSGGTGGTSGAAGEASGASAGEGSGGTAGGTGGSGGTGGGVGGKAGTAGTGGGSDPYARTFLYGGRERDLVHAMVADEEGYIYLAGESSSVDGDIVDSKHPETREVDAWLLKIDKTGAIIWSVTYDFPDSDSSERFTAVALLDDDYLALGGNVLDDDDAGSEDDTDGFVMRVAREDGQAYFLRRISGDDDAVEASRRDNDDEVTRVRAWRTFTNSTLYTYEVLGQSMTRDSGVFPAKSSSHFDAMRAFVHEPDPVPVGPTTQDYAVLVGGSGGPDTFLFFVGETGLIGTAAGSNDHDFENWADETGGFSDIFHYDTAGVVDGMVNSNETDVIAGMDGTLFAGWSTSWEGDLPCVADQYEASDIWFGRWENDGPPLHCVGGDGGDEGVAIIDVGSAAWIVANTSLPGSGDLAALGEDDNVFVMRINESFELTDMVGVPAPSRSEPSEAKLALRLPDGTLVVAGDSLRHISESRLNHGSSDMWVTFLEPGF
jgi:hypothetical protein